MSDFLPTIEELVRHRGQMLLIDSLVEASQDHAVGEVVISQTSSFFKPGRGVPAYVGLEYMAQTIAAFDGAHRLKSGAAPEIGFLLGTRRYASKVQFFLAQSLLKIRVNMVFSENGMAAFDCAIDVSDEEIVTASINVYRPQGDQLVPPRDAE